MSVPTVLAKAVYDNIADSPDELTFRKGDVITVLEKDIDGLFGWWLCSLHGRQGIAPGNRLTEIGAGPKYIKAPPVSQRTIIEDLDYAVPKPYEDHGDDYDVPRSVLSPQDYDFPKSDGDSFAYPPVQNGTDTRPVVEDLGDNIYQEIYDVPSVPSPQKTTSELQSKGVKPEAPYSSKSKPTNQVNSAIQSPKATQPELEQSRKATLPKTHPKPPRKINAEKNKGSGPPSPARPPKPALLKATLPKRVDAQKNHAKEGGDIYCVPTNQDIYEVPRQEPSSVPPAIQTPSKGSSPSSDDSSAEQVALPLSKNKIENFAPEVQATHGSVMPSKGKETSQLSTSTSLGTPVLDSKTTGSTPQDLYDSPNVDASGEEIYDVPTSIKGHQDGDLYDTPPRIPTGTIDRKNNNHGKPMDVNHNKRSEKPLAVTGGLIKRDSGGLNRLSDGSSKRSSGGSSADKRGSSGSTGSGKQSSEDDDYVDYQDIYGDGQEKPVNIYDVPVQPVQVSGSGETAPLEKKTKVSILQRINMSAVKGLKLDPPGALQRLTKLEQAVDGTITKLLSYVTSTWRDPVQLRPKLADIRDITGKGKVALRLLTEFGLSSLVNARSLPSQELSGKLSRTIEPLLETYYSLKLALQRLDDNDWRAPLERENSSHDDLDLIMVYIRSVPENSKKLVSIVRTAATTLYIRPRKGPVPIPAKEPKVDLPKKAPKPTSNVQALKKDVSVSRNDSKPVPQPTATVNGDTGASGTAPSGGDTSKNVTSSDEVTEEVAAKVEKFGPVSMTAESETVNSTTMMVGLIKETVDANIKPSGRKFSPTTVRRLCGMNSQQTAVQESEDEVASEGPKSTHERQSSDPEDVPKLPPRSSSSSGGSFKNPPPPPQRRDSGERFQHVRNKSLERFVPESNTKPVPAPANVPLNVPPNPPPKPKLDRKKTMRKSYKFPMRSETENERVTLREHKISEPESPTQGKRKCNSDPTDLEMNPEVNNTKTNRVSDSMESKVPENLITRSSSVHVSDSDLPRGLTGQPRVVPLSPKIASPSPREETLKTDSLQRTPSFSRTMPPRAKTTMGEQAEFGEFILSFSDKELLEFYRYEIDAQLFVLNEAMKGLFSSIDNNQPPKSFVSNSKFVVLSAHKFIYIGDTLQKKISRDILGTDITKATTALSRCVKTLIHATKMAALQYPALNSMREMTTAAAEVSTASIELHKVVKYEARK